MGNFNIQCQKTVNWLSTHADLLPLSGMGGYNGEPGLTMVNDAISDIFCYPNDYKWNSKVMPILYSSPNLLDQNFGGATIFSLNALPNGTQTGRSQGWGIDLASNNAITVGGGKVTVALLSGGNGSGIPVNHRFAVGDIIYMNGVTMTTGTASFYNSAFTDNGTVSQWTGGWAITATTSTTITFTATAGQNNGDVGGAPGITDYAYATSVTFQELNNNSSPPNTSPGTVYRELPVISQVANPSRVSVIADNGDGTLKIRYNPIPGTAVWGSMIVYQPKPTFITDLSQNWPVPDQYQGVVNQAMVYRGFRFCRLAQADNEYKKLQAEIAKALAKDETEETDVRLGPEVGLMDGAFLTTGDWWL